MSRNGKGVFSRQSENDVSAPDWFSDFSSNLQKMSVQPAHRDKALFDQISEILGNKSRYATVEEAVQDLQKRTGLAQYLQMCEAEKVEVHKNAADHAVMKEDPSTPVDEEELIVMLDPDTDEVQYPVLLKEHPHIERFITNFVTSRRGYIHVPAVIEAVRSVFKNENFTSDELEDKHLRKFINELIIKEKSQHNKDYGSDVDLGKIPSSSNDTEQKDDFFAIFDSVK